MSNSRKLTVQESEPLGSAGATIEQLQEIRRLMLQCFSALCNYDFRTPASSIVGYSKVMLAERESPLTEGQKSDLTRILQSGQRIIQTINETLGLLQIEAYIAGFDESLHLEEVDLKRIIDEIKSSNLGNIAEIETSVPQDLPNVQASPEGVKYALSNILLALREDNKGRIVLNAVHDNSRVVVSVTNPEFTLAESIQEEFKNPVQLPTVFASGNLGVCRRLVEAQNGEMSLDAREEVGTIVTFTLSTRRAIHKSD